jgi:hypothetical protein
LRGKVTIVVVTHRNTRCRPMWNSRKADGAAGPLPLKVSLVLVSRLLKFPETIG